MKVRFLVGVVGFSLVAAAVAPAGGVSLASAATTSPQLVQFAGATELTAAKSLTAKFPATTTAGDLLVLSASVYTGTTNRITSVTDSAGRSWVRIGSYAVSGHNSDGEMWYSANAASVTTVTVRTTSSAVMALSVQEFSGVAATSPLDVAAGKSASSVSPSSGAVTPTLPGDLAVGFIAGHGNKQTINVTAPGYTSQPQQTSAATQVASVVTGYSILSTVSAQTFTGSLGTPMYWASGITMFKPVAAVSNDFSIAATPATATVTGGHNTTFAVSSGVTSGVSQPIALSVTGLPDGASASFAPSTISAGDTATMTVSASISTAPGTTQPSVVGTGTSATHITPVPLTVNAPAVIRAAFDYPRFPAAWTTQGTRPDTQHDPNSRPHTTHAPTGRAAKHQSNSVRGGVTVRIPPGGG